MRGLVLAPVLLGLIGVFSQCIAGEWGCYDPQPGHPTSTEQRSFVNEIGPLAQKAEQNYGVPAAAIAAMAVAESGYGWTRTALNAQNFFGWKYTSGATSGGRRSFSLTCQPPEDVNNKYIVFSDQADAVDFVARKLADLSFYKPATDRYRAARTAGGDPKNAIRQWVAGIAVHYNWKPEQYTETIIRTMNDPLFPSDQISENLNLYQLTAAATPPGEPTGDTLIAYAASKISPWQSAHCDQPQLDYPRWAGFPVTLCDYTDIGVTVRTHMLNADRPKQARWTVTACKDAQTTNMKACIDYLVEVVRVASSGGIFPVSGYIPEPQGGGICYVFRDGVTVWTTLHPQWQSPKNRSCGTFDEADQPLAKAWVFARIASTTREEYIAAGGTSPVDGLHWVDVARELYQKAWNSDRNELMSATAIAAKRNHKF